MIYFRKHITKMPGHFTLQDYEIYKLLIYYNRVGIILYIIILRTHPSKKNANHMTPPPPRSHIAHMLPLDTDWRKSMGTWPRTLLAQLNIEEIYWCKNQEIMPFHQGSDRNWTEIRSPKVNNIDYIIHSSAFLLHIIYLPANTKGLFYHLSSRMLIL